MSQKCRGFPSSPWWAMEDLSPKRSATNVQGQDVQQGKVEHVIDEDQSSHQISPVLDHSKISKVYYRNAGSHGLIGAPQVQGGVSTSVARNLHRCQLGDSVNPLHFLAEALHCRPEARCAHLDERTGELLGQGLR